MLSVKRGRCALNNVKLTYTSNAELFTMSFSEIMSFSPVLHHSESSDHQRSSRVILPVITDPLHATKHPPGSSETPFCVAESDRKLTDFRGLRIHMYTHIYYRTARLETPDHNFGSPCSRIIRFFSFNSLLSHASDQTPAHLTRPPWGFVLSTHPTPFLAKKCSQT